jgi:endonuclease/exonuclease/phosphatase family metal-dependent hydrolase
MLGKTVLKWVMLASNFVALFFMIMTLIGSTVSPDKFLLAAYFTLIYPYVIIINAGFVVFWLFARKWFFLLSLSILLFSTNQINETIPVHFGKTTSIIPKNPIHILTYNTMMSGKLVKNTKKKPNKVIQYIVNSNADIICLQEFMVSTKNMYQTHADMIHDFRKYKYKHICYVREEKNQIYGIATFSKFPIINRQKVDYPSYANVSIYSDILIQGDTIRLFNNHLESNRLTETDKAMPRKLKDNFDTQNLAGMTLHFSRKLGFAYKLRALQADIVSEEIKKSPYKIIVCGDFNDVPASYAYTKVKGNLCDSFEETGLGIGWTYNEGFYKFRIDYVLYDSKSFSTVSYKTDKVYYSDHYPVLCQLQIK